MDFNYEKLFTVHVEHMYFADFHFSGYKIFPTAATQTLFHQYDLILKLQPGGFLILFANSFEGSNRDRESVLKELITLQFTFQISDPSFYNYTGNLPDNIDKRIFWFSNLDEIQQDWRKSDLLHTFEFVSESEMKPSPHALNYTGYIEIKFGVHIQEDLYIRFLNRSTYWRYIFIGENFQKFENLVILDKDNQQLFSGPEIVELPGGRKGIAFTSIEPIALTQRYNKYFQLVVNYDETTSHFENKLLSNLPVPSPQMTPKFDDGNIISEIFIA